LNRARLCKSLMREIALPR